MAFDRRSKALHRGRFDILHQGYRVRIAHGHGGDLQSFTRDLQCVGRCASRCVKRDIPRFEAGFAHVDGDLAIVFQDQQQQSARRLDAQFALVRQAPVMHEAHETARPVAALGHLAAVRVEDAVAEIGLRAAGPLDQQQLVAADAPMPVGQPAYLFRGQGNGSG